MPENNLKIAIIPHDIIENDAAANLAAVEKRLSTVDSDTDLVVLPEMFNTGYANSRHQLRQNAETDDGVTMQTVRKWAMTGNMAIWGGFTAVDDRENLYNRGFMMSPDGTTVFYDKRHLFRAGGEHKLLTPGDRRSPIVSFRGWRLKMSICYDIRFPVWNRSVANEYDALIVPANWAHSRVFAWKHMLLARAIENQAYIIGCNREGSDRFGKYPAGDSFAFNHWGDDIADRRTDGLIYALLDGQQLDVDRKRFSPWMDADRFEIML